MKLKPLAYLLLAWCCVSCTAAPGALSHSSSEANKDRWAIYYDYRLSAEKFQGDDLVVFDRVYYPDFRKIQKKTTVLAYISAGEISTTSPDAVLLESEHAILGTTNWQTNLVDLSSPRWRTILMGQVEDALHKNFDGVMLGALDGALKAAADKSPEALEENQKAVVAFISDIHAKHPRMKIMLNRAFDILPLVASKIDYVLAETILTERGDSAGQFRLVAPNTFQQMAGTMRWAHDLSPSIKIYTLDYWNMNDPEGIKKIYRMQREQGFSPYVTSPDLRHFTPEPE